MIIPIGLKVCMDWIQMDMIRSDLDLDIAIYIRLDKICAFDGLDPL